MILSEIEWDGQDCAPIDAELARLKAGGRACASMVMGSLSILDCLHLAEAAGCFPEPAPAPEESVLVLGRSVTGYLHPDTGERVEIFSWRGQAERRIGFSDETAAALRRDFGLSGPEQDDSGRLSLGGEGSIGACPIEVQAAAGWIRTMALRARSE
jgi:hypothetical protein